MGQIMSTFLKREPNLYVRRFTGMSYLGFLIYQSKQQVYMKILSDFISFEFVSTISPDFLEAPSFLRYWKFCEMLLPLDSLSFGLLKK